MSNRPTEDPTKIGIMHAAYRVGKVQLVNWINEALELKYAKVEDCANASCYVQLLDAVYDTKQTRNAVKKCKWDAQDPLCNWKLVQAIFLKQKVQKNIDICNLNRGKFQDNLEFLQWFRFFFECKYDEKEYNALKRRGKKGGEFKVLPINAAGGTTVGAKANSSSYRAASTKKTGPGKKTKSKKKPAKKKTKSSGGGGSSKGAEERIAKLELTVEAVEKERNFYFGKLREIEILCQESDETDVKALKKSILDIMYKTDEDGDMVAPGEGDEEGSQDDAPEEEDGGEEYEISGDGEDTTTF